MHHSSLEKNADRPAVELLTATAYQTPDSVLSPEESSPGRRARSPILALSLFLLLVAIITAICTAFILKLRAPDTAVGINHVEEIGSAPTQAFLHAAAQRKLKPATTNSMTVAEAMDDGPSVFRAAMNAAEKSMNQYLIKRAELDQMGVSRWGGEEYEQLEELDKLADEAMIAPDYQQAATLYQKASEILNLLSASSESAFRSSLVTGHEALRQGNGDGANEAFETALMIHPDNSEAREGWKRAQSVDQVFKLMHAGLLHEQAGRLSLALIDYKQAAAIVPQHDCAAEALKQVKIEICEWEYRQLVSAGLAALSRGDLELAKSELSEADLFQPGRAELVATIREVDEAIRDKKISTLKLSSDQAMAAERWQEAYNLYKQALAIDPTLLFAQHGIEASREHLQIYSQMGQYVTNRQILEIPENLDNARLLLQEAESISTPGPKFSDQLSQFQQILTHASTPIPVLLTSDGLTEVSVYLVGRQGIFQQYQFDLLPGTYTIVGSRDGFRDVRKKVRVDVGAGPMSVHVVCEERIGR